MKKTTSRTLVLIGILALAGCSNADNNSTSSDHNTSNHSTSHSVSTDNNATNAVVPIAKQVVDTAKEQIDIANNKARQTHDVVAISSAMQKLNLSFDVGQKWQARLAGATSEQEVRQVLNEQLTTATQIQNELAKLTLYSDEGKQIAGQLSTGVQTTHNAIQQLSALDFSDPNLESKVAPINQQVLAGGQNMFMAAEALLQLRQSLGFKNNEEAMRYYQAYKQQFEALKQDKP